MEDTSVVSEPVVAEDPSVVAEPPYARAEYAFVDEEPRNVTAEDPSGDA